MSSSLTLRSATADDESAVVALWHACGLVASYNDPSADFQRALAKPGSAILVGINAAGHVVGSVMVGHDGHRGWVWYVAAHPDHRKLGIGRAMVEAAEAWLNERGVPKVMLLIRDTNTQVVDFYEHIGYTSIPRVVMEKWLTKPPAA